MSTHVIARLVRAYCYAIAPYLCLYLALPHKRDEPGAKLVFGIIAANAAFILTATLVAEVSMNLYYVLHPILAAAGAALLIYRWRLSGWKKPELDVSAPVIVALVIIVLAFAVRLAPILLGGESLGGGDARFHNILAKKLISTGRLCRDWLPFADVGVMYPQGSHTLVVFLAAAARCPVHLALNFMFPVVGALSAAAVYLLARLLFRSDTAAAWSSCCYAFLAVWGSLDLYRWGGLPNAMGMLILCALLLTILGHGPSRSVPAALGAALLIPAILVTHHYTLIVAAIMLASIALFTADGKLRRFTILAAVLGALIALPLLVLHYLRFLGSVGKTNVLVYREPIRTALFYLQHMGPALVAAFVCAMFLARKARWTAEQLAVLAWFTGLFAAFVFLEYIYRGAVLLFTRGADCFSCLTASRMITDMVYPMSILCGAVTVSRQWKKYRRLWVSGLVLLSIATSALVCRAQIDVGVFPELRAAARWLCRHSDPNAMIVGSMPYVEYLAWRETSDPPLPASEQRNHRSVRWKREMGSFDAWLEWERTSRRPVYFVLPTGMDHPPFLNQVFSNKEVTIVTTQEPPAPVPSDFRRP